MTPINDIPGLLTAIQTFAMLHGANVPTSVQSHALQGNPQNLVITAASQVSPVVAICDIAEVLYAYRDEIPSGPSRDAAMTLAGQCAIYAAQNAWHGMAVPTESGSSRGVGICWAMQRELGETPTSGSWPAAASDPTVDPRFSAPATPETTTPSQ